MALDLKISGGTVVDGTGAAGRRADVGVRDGIVVAVGEVDEGAARTIDATGLVVAPGFVDLHTHYDAQLHWDAAATPSCFHGVTTVFGGNCGFTLAPAGEEHVDYLARLMARVEGIPLAALETGVPWSWRTFGEFLDGLDGTTAVNAGFLAGHSALRRAALGSGALDEDLSDTAIEAMGQLLDEALAAGALGFSSSQAPTHNDGDGNPVPSRAASRRELLALAARVRAYPGTQLEIIIPGCLNGFTDDEVDLLAALSLAADRPINWNVLGVAVGGNHDQQLAASSVAAERGATVVALTLPQSMRIRLSFLTGFVLDGLPGWRDVLGKPVPERLVALSDPDVRRHLDERAHSPEAGILGGLAHWERLEIVEGFTPDTRALEGRRVGQIAAERGVDPFDALLDIVVADGLRTGLRPDFGADPADVWPVRAGVWRDGRAVVGASDAGAHLDMMCGASYSTFLVGPAVHDHHALALEEAVRLLTDVPARLYGLTGRGRLEPGTHADLVLFDPDTVGPRPERTVDDLPGGASRIVAEADGVESVLVAGVSIVEAGAITGATPGTVLRSGRDTTTVTAGSWRL